MPDIIETIVSLGVVGRAKTRSLFDFENFNIRDFTTDVHATIDDRPFGGGPGMVMKIEPLTRCMKAAAELAPVDNPFTVYLSPQGHKFNQPLAREFAEKEALLLVAGRYEGVDERFIESNIDLELSVGDYILSGGELAALIVVDAVVRLLPGTLGNPNSVDNDSFSFNEGLLDYPQYTRPREYNGLAVPEVLLSGDHAAIKRWRYQQALLKTYHRRPDLLQRRVWSADERRMLKDGIPLDDV